MIWPNLEWKSCVRLFVVSFFLGKAVDYLNLEHFFLQNEQKIADNFCQLYETSHKMNEFQIVRTYHRQTVFKHLKIFIILSSAHNIMPAGQ